MLQLYCTNDSAAGSGCVAFAGWSTGTVEVYGEIADSVDSLHFVLWNETEFSAMSCSGDEYCCWTVPEIGTFSFVHQVHYACFPSL